MAKTTGVLSRVHGVDLPPELVEKIAEIRGLVDLDEVQKVVLRMSNEIGADRVNPERFSPIKKPLYADGSKPCNIMDGLRIIGEARDLTEAEHKAAQLKFDLDVAYSKLLSAIEDLASVQTDIHASNS